MELLKRIISRPRWLLLQAGLAGWLRRARQNTGFRRCESPPGQIKPGNQNKKTFKQISNKIMESRLRILHWLSLLLLSAGLVGWSRKARQDIWFRRCEMPPGYKRKKPYNNNRIRELNKIPMESRLRILRWLSLLLLSAGFVGWSKRAWRTSGFPWLHKKTIGNSLFKWKSEKQKIKIYKRTMKLQLQMMRWLSLLLLSEGFRWESDSLSHFAWFRRP